MRERGLPVTNKEYLGGAYRIDQRINSKIEQAASLRDLATKATATYSDTPASGGDIQSMEAVIVKIVDLEQEINADIDALVDFKREIIGAIKSLADPECQMLLELRYLCFRSWAEIAVALGCSMRKVFRLHDKALNKIVQPRKVAQNAIECHTPPVV